MLLGITFRIATAPRQARRPGLANSKAAPANQHHRADGESRDQGHGQQRHRAPRDPETLGFTVASDLATPARAVAAARAFAAGNGYLTGLIVDRFA